MGSGDPQSLQHDLESMYSSWKMNIKFSEDHARLLGSPFLIHVTPEIQAFTTPPEKVKRRRTWASARKAKSGAYRRPKSRSMSVSLSST